MNNVMFGKTFEEPIRKLDKLKKPEDSRNQSNFETFKKSTNL